MRFNLTSKKSKGLTTLGSPLPYGSSKHQSSCPLFRKDMLLWACQALHDLVPYHTEPVSLTCTLAALALRLLNFWPWAQLHTCTLVGSFWVTCSSHYSTSQLCTNPFAESRVDSCLLEWRWFSGLTTRAHPTRAEETPYSLCVSNTLDHLPGWKGVELTLKLQKVCCPSECRGHCPNLQPLSTRRSRALGGVRKDN